MEGDFNSHLATYLTTPGTRTIRLLWDHSCIEGANCPVGSSRGQLRTVAISSGPQMSGAKVVWLLDNAGKPGPPGPAVASSWHCASFVQLGQMATEYGGNVRKHTETARSS